MILRTLLLGLLVGAAGALDLFTAESPTSTGKPLPALSAATAPDLISLSAGQTAQSFLFGGYNDARDESLSSEFWLINGSQWRCISCAPEWNNISRPSSRAGAASWLKQDSTGSTLYIYAGDGLGYLDAATAAQPGNNMTRGVLADLWSFDPVAGSFQLVHGSTIINERAITGNSPTPGGRSFPSRWGSDNTLYIYGGWGYGRPKNPAVLADLWFYNISMARWYNMKLPDVVNVSTTFISPGSRAHASVARAQPNSADMYLFGGQRFYNNAFWEVSNDLWYWSSSTSNWTLLFEGAITEIEPSAVYDKMLRPSSTSRPGRRRDATMFVDPKGCIWIVGGYGYDAVGNLGVLSDTWVFDPVLFTWTWVDGPMLAGSSAVGFPPRMYSQSWPVVGPGTASKRAVPAASSFRIFGGVTLSAPNKVWSLLSDVWRVDTDKLVLDIAAPCAAYGDCTCTGTPPAASLICRNNTWVITSDQGSVVISEPLPIGGGSALDLQSKVVTVVGNLTVSGSVRTSVDPSTSSVGSVFIENGCLNLLPTATLLINLSNPDVISVGGLRVDLISWDPNFCLDGGNTFSTLLVSSSHPDPSGCTPRITAQQDSSSKPGTLAVLFSLDSADCAPAPSEGSGAAGTPIVSPSSHVGFVVAGAAFIALAILVAGIIIYRRRRAQQIEVAVDQATKSVLAINAAAINMTDTKTIVDAGWWIDMPESPRSAASQRSEAPDPSLPPELQQAPSSRQNPPAAVVHESSLDMMLEPEEMISRFLNRFKAQSASPLGDSVLTGPGLSEDIDPRSPSYAVAMKMANKSYRASASRGQRGSNKPAAAGREVEAGSEAESVSEVSVMDSALSHGANEIIQSGSVSSMSSRGGVLRSVPPPAPDLLLYESISSSTGSSPTVGRINISSSSSSSSSRPRSSRIITDAQVQLDESKMSNLLGTGSCGTVYVGRYNASRAAFKKTALLTPDEAIEPSSPQFILFTSEMQVIMDMRPHKSVVKTIGVYSRDGGASRYIVEEYCCRGPLSAALQDGELMLKDKVRIIERIAAGLAHLHRHGLLMHRHMRAQSILLDAGLRPKLSDYGLILTEKHAVLAPAHSLMDRARWLAPEVLSLGSFSTAADVYSFGLLVVEILTERPPYPELSDMDFLMMFMEKRVFPKLPDWCPRYLREIISVCLSADPKQRPTMKDVVTLLRLVRRSSVASELESV